MFPVRQSSFCARASNAKETLSGPQTGGRPGKLSCQSGGQISLAEPSIPYRLETGRNVRALNAAFPGRGRKNVWLPRAQRPHEAIEQEFAVGPGTQPRFRVDVTRPAGIDEPAAPEPGHLAGMAEACIFVVPAGQYRRELQVLSH